MAVLSTLPRLFALLGWGVILGGAMVTGAGFWFVFAYEPSWGSWWLGLMWVVWWVFWTLFVYAWVLLGGLVVEHVLDHRAAVSEHDTVVTRVPGQRRG